jgi:hypothetical protein
VPGFLDRFSSTPLAILGTHHNLVLFRPATTTRQGETLQYFFIYDARGGCRFPKLLGLPPCREPEFDYTRSDGSLPPPPRRHLLPPCARLLTVDDGSALKFVNVTRHDGLAFGALERGTGFVIDHLPHPRV